MAIALLVRSLAVIGDFSMFNIRKLELLGGFETSEYSPFDPIAVGVVAIVEPIVLHV
jgi:hypothetical protein